MGFLADRKAMKQRPAAHFSASPYYRQNDANLKPDDGIEMTGKIGFAGTRIDHGNCHASMRKCRSSCEFEIRKGEKQLG